MKELHAFKIFEPSPELDRLIAAIVLGWEEQPNNWFLPSGDVLSVLPNFSSDLNAAWIVVNRLLPVLSDRDSGDGDFFLRCVDRDMYAIEQLPCCPNFDAWHPPYGARWSAHFHTGELVGVLPGKPPRWRMDQSYCAVGVTPPHAICLAALSGWLERWDEGLKLPK